MGKISREDLRIILAFALHTAKVDQEFAQSERAVIKQYLDRIQFTDAERQSLTSQKVSLSEGLEHLSGKAAKELLVKTICTVAFSDGVMRESETEFVHRVSHQLKTGMTLLPQDRWGEYEAEVMKALQAAN